MIPFKDFVLSEENKILYKKKVDKALKLDHYQENEVFSGHFNVIHEAIWLIAMEYFTNKNKGK